MYGKLARVIASVASAALLALTLAACGDSTPAAKPPPKEKEKTEEKKEGAKPGDAKEVTYKCANEGCAKGPKTAASGAPAPQ